MRARPPSSRCRVVSAAVAVSCARAPGFTTPSRGFLSPERAFGFMALSSRGQTVDAAHGLWHGAPWLVDPGRRLVPMAGRRPEDFVSRGGSPSRDCRHRDDCGSLARCAACLGGQDRQLYVGGSIGDGLRGHRCVQGRAVGLEGPESGIGATPVRLSDGTTGWRMQRFDDCLRAAIATVLQVAIDEVPDPHLNAKLRAGWQPSSVTQVTEITLTRWCEQRGLRMTRHDAPPWNRKRWIGVVPPPRRVTAGPFMSHCLVMCRREILHDPFALNSLVARYVAERFQKKTWLPSDVQYGFTFNKRKEAK